MSDDLTQLQRIVSDRMAQLQSVVEDIGVMASQTVLSTLARTMTSEGMEPIDLLDALRQFNSLNADYDRQVSEALGILGGNMNDWGDMYASEFFELARLASVYGLNVKRRKRAYRSKPGPDPMTEEELHQWAEKLLCFKGTLAEFSGLNVISMRQIRYIRRYIKEGR